MLEIIESSGLITLQDLGRRGFQRFGVPHSGPMDWFAHRAANRLVGNSPEEAVLEIGLGEASFRARTDCVLAVTGAGYEVMNYVWTFPLWTSFYVRAGWKVQIKKQGNGNWAYLAVAGGFENPLILNSRSTYLRGHLGEAISAGTQLSTGKPIKELSKLAARNFPQHLLPLYSQTPTIQVIPGPQRGWFTYQGLTTFLGSEYTLSSSFDRMGYRLEGKSIQQKHKVELISEGMTMGSVQIPANGQPIIMMADSPTTGGYPKVATVTQTSLPILSQCEAGISKIKFKETDVETAQREYKKLYSNLNEASL